MADVFLSYKKEDRPRVGPIVNAIEAAGFSVWWDDRLTPEGQWDDTITREIEAAKAVVVLWTDRSVKSKWVRTEAHYANERRKLIPVRIEDCNLPIAFMLNQTADLAGWGGNDEDMQWRKLLEWIEELTQADPATVEGESGGGDTDLGSRQWRNTYGQTAIGEVIFDGTTVSRRTAGGTFFKDAADLPVMCVLPAGSFAMGSPRDDPDRRDSEMPRHVVDLSSPFAIGIYQVTFGDWDMLQEHGLIDHVPSDSGWGRGCMPVIDVSWTDAQTYVKALSQRSGMHYRLLSESEWEYACRAGSTGSFSVGAELTIEQANCNPGPDSGSLDCASDVGTYAPNAFGLYDTHGNVREWVEDLWHDDYNEAPADGLPWTSGHSAMHVLRGGCWLDAPWFLRSAARGRGGEHDRTNFIGFRIGRDID
jgi:formylglycine-generating enzyme required for sulfatase activity